MKKVMSLSLAAVLAFSAIPTAFAHTKAVNATAGAKPKVEVKLDAKAKATGNQAKPSASNKEAVQQAVKLKQELIELRQQLKAATEANDELKAKYETLVAELEKQKALQNALEVQLELLQRFYQASDQTDFQKLGELYEKLGDASVKAFVNGKQPAFDVPPFIDKGRTLVPIRAISSALKADVKWEDTTRMAVITRGDTMIILYLDKAEAKVNGKNVKLDIKPVIKNGRIFLPLRFVSEQLQAKVIWQPKGKIVIIEDVADDATNTNTSTDKSTGTTTDTNTSTDTNTGTTTDTNTSTN